MNNCLTECKSYQKLSLALDATKETALMAESRELRALHECRLLRAQIKKLKAEIHPDWDKLEVCREALREYAGMVQERDAEIERLRDGDTCARMCEGTAYRVEARRLRAENSELRDKALRYDLDQAGIAAREKDAVELVEARAEIERLREALNEQDKKWYKQHAEIERLREALKMAGTTDEQLICNNGYTLGYVVKAALAGEDKT